MSNSEPASDATEKQADKSQSVWSGRAGPIFWAGLVVGLLLAIGGFVSLSGALVGSTTGQLILCSGLGVIFGAFGSTGTANYKGVVITGVAAIAIALLLVVDYLIEDSYVELDITGDIRGAQIEIVGDENYLGAPRERSHRFIVIAREIRKSFVTVSVSLPLEEDNESEGGGEYLFECVHKGEIEKYLGSGQIVQWRFDREKGQLLDSNARRKIADVGACPELADAADAPGGSLLAGLGFSVISRAFAQQSTDVQAPLKELEADSVYTRRKARESLAQQGLPAVQPMADRLLVEPSYRTRLGIIVAMTEMLRENKSDRQKVSALLTQDHLNSLVAASADKDRTIRVYASEFLYDLADIRVVPTIFDVFGTADDNGKYNLLVVLDGVYPALDSATREHVNAKLSGIRGSVGVKTQQLIDRIAGRAAEQHYWVIIGSYTDKSEAQAHADRVNRESNALKAFVGKRQPDNAYYPVIVGEYVPRPQAEELARKALQLKSVQEYKGNPYLSAYADRRP